MSAFETAKTADARWSGRREGRRALEGLHDAAASAMSLGWTAQTELGISEFDRRLLTPELARAWIADWEDAGLTVIDRVSSMQLLLDALPEGVGPDRLWWELLEAGVHPSYRAAFDLAKDGGFLDATEALSEADSVIHDEARNTAIAELAGQEALGPAGLDNAWARAELSLADNFEEMQATFLSYYPDGQLKLVHHDGEDVILFSRTAGETLALLDEPEFSIGDIADHVDILPAIAGSDIAKSALAFFLGGPLGLAARMLAAATGASLGELGVELFKESRGHRRRSVENVGQEFYVEFAVTGILEAVVDRIPGLSRVPGFSAGLAQRIVKSIFKETGGGVASDAAEDYLEER